VWFPLDHPHDPEAGGRELVDVHAHRPVVGVHGQPLHGPGLRIPGVVEVVREVRDVARIARVDDREDEPAVRLQHAGHGGVRRSEPRQVHQRHVADDAVERLPLELPQVLRVPVDVPDAPRRGELVLPRALEHPLRDVDPDHGRAEVGEEPRVLSLAAGKREDPPAGDVAEQLLEHGILEP
jgi:hypothetical protein